VRHPEDETWCPGWFVLKGSEHRYRDWKKGGHGHIELRQAIAQSCDVYFYSLAHELGIERIHDGLRHFGFGLPTGIDIGGEAAGVVPSRDWKRKAFEQPWYPGETLILGIGQGYVLTTPMQLAAATATLAGRGWRAAPHLFLSARDPISQVSLEAPEPRREKRVSVEHPADWDEVITAMMEVTHGTRGTARRIGQGAPYRIAGKTGTAQVIGMGQDEEYEVEEIPEELRDHALFIAFAPVEAPRIALAIIVENGGSGSASAAPIARVLFDHYLGAGSGGGHG
jgi:penicillin-binding protein 2